MDSNFDLEEAWDKVVAAWAVKYPKNPLPRNSNHRSVFEQQVSSNAECELVLEAIASRDAKKSMERLDQIIRGVKAFERTHAAQITRADLNNKRDSAAEEATALQIAHFWPRNTASSEREAQRLQVLMRAFSQYNHKEVLMGTRFYSEQFQKHQAGDFPYTLTNFIERNDGELLKFWTANAKYQPNSDEIQAFEAAWSWYPDFEEKEAAKDQAFVLFRQWIDTGEKRLQFICALQHYGDNVSGKEKRYIKSFRKFVRTWDRDDPEERSRRMSHLAEQVVRGVRNWALENNIRWPEWSDGGVSGVWAPLCKDKDITVRQALEQFWTEWLKRPVDAELLDGFMEQAWKWVTRPLPR